MLPFLKQSGDAVLLSVKVQPRASRNEVGPTQGNELKIKVTAPPVDSAANEAVLDLLAERLDCSRNALQLVRGQTSRHKVIGVRGIAMETIAQTLAGNS